MARPYKLTVCGSGPGSQLIAGVAASRPNFEVTVFTLDSDAAKDWNKALKGKDATMISNFPRRDGSMYAEKGKPTAIEEKAGDFITESEVIIMATPPSLFSQYITAIKDKVKKGTVFIGLPGCCGFEYLCRSILGEVGEQCTMVNIEYFPWQYTVVTFGVQVDVKTTLKSLLASTVFGTSPPRRGPLSTLQMLFGGEVGLCSSPSFMCVQLSPFNYLVPGLMYGKWKDWDGKGMEEEPGLFADITDTTANLLKDIADECLKITEAIVKEKPEAKVGDVKSLADWLIEYKDCISDNSSLMTSLKTNSMLGDAKQPMVKKENKSKVEYTPDFEGTLSEYVAHNLIVIRGIAEILAVPTPKLDELILWSQGKTEKAFLKDGKLLTDKAIKNTCCPQNFEIKTLNGLFLIKSLPPIPVMPDLTELLAAVENKESTEKSAAAEKTDSKEKSDTKDKADTKEKSDTKEKADSKEKSDSKDKPAKAEPSKLKKK